MKNLWAAAVGAMALILVAAAAVDVVARAVDRAADTSGTQLAEPDATSPPTTAPRATHRHSAAPVIQQKKKPPVKAAKIPADGPNSYVGAHLWRPPQGKQGALITYNVRVQKGLPYDANATALFIQSVLNDKRSWGRSGDWQLKLVPTTAHADVEAYLVTPATTDRLCAPLDTGGKVSCFNNHRVVLNADRWAYGAASYGHHLIDYRRNLVNHEFGHSLGHDHVTCPGKGKLAPIMMQQTKGLHGCRANPWPYPKA